MHPLARRALYVVSRLRRRERFTLHGARFEVAPGVLNPTLFRASLLFAHAALRHAPRRPARVLELGCGCGLAAVLLARAGHAVVALDRDVRAAANTRGNARRNGALVRVLASDWDAALWPEASFDYVVSNPPFLTDEPPAQRAALFAGAGLQALGDALAASARRLTRDGRALLFTSERSGRARVLELIAGAGLRPLAAEAARQSGERFHVDLLARAEPP